MYSNKQLHHCDITDLTGKNGLWWSATFLMAHLLKRFSTLKMRKQMTCQGHTSLQCDVQPCPHSLGCERIHSW